MTIIDHENAPVDYTVSLVIEGEKHVQMEARIEGITNQQPNLEVEAWLPNPLLNSPLNVPPYWKLRNPHNILIRRMVPPTALWYIKNL